MFLERYLAREKRSRDNYLIREDSGTARRRSYVTYRHLRRTTAQHHHHHIYRTRYNIKECIASYRRMKRAAHSFPLYLSHPLTARNLPSFNAHTPPTSLHYHCESSDWNNGVPMAVIECCICKADNCSKSYYSCKNCGHVSDGCCIWIGEVEVTMVSRCCGLQREANAGRCCVEDILLWLMS